MCFSGVYKVYLRWKYGAEMAKWLCIFGVYMLDFLHFGCQSGENSVRFRRFSVRFAVKCGAETAVWLCGKGSFDCWFWRLVVWLRRFLDLVSLWFRGGWGVGKFVNFNFFNSIRRFFFAECRFVVIYAKYKELSKALSIRAFGVLKSKNAVFRMEKRRIHGEKTPVSNEKTAFSNRGSSILCEKVPFSVFRTAKCVLNSAEMSVSLSCFAVKV